MHQNTIFSGFAHHPAPVPNIRTQNSFRIRTDRVSGRGSQALQLTSFIGNPQRQISPLPHTYVKPFNRTPLRSIKSLVPCTEIPKSRCTVLPKSRRIVTGLKRLTQPSKSERFPGANQDFRLQNETELTSWTRMFTIHASANRLVHGGSSSVG